jgi:hypothetical protein
LRRVFSDWSVKILAVAGAVLLFVFHRMNNLSERTFDVPLEVILPVDYVLAEPLRSQVSLTIRGERADDIRASTAEDYRASVDLTAYTREGPFEVPIDYGRRDGEGPQGVFVSAVEPREITVSLERVAEETLRVTANLVGDPQAGYYLAQYTITPSLVRIRGPRSRIELISSITTAEIDLAGISGDYKTRVNLQIDDPLISLVEVSHVEFYGIIKRTMITREYRDVPIVPVSAPDGTRWTVRPEVGGLRIRGPEIELEDPELAPRLVIDLSGQVPGQASRATPRPEVPEGLVVVDFFPREVIVTGERTP